MTHMTGVRGEFGLTQPQLALWLLLANSSRCPHEAWQDALATRHRAGLSVL